jgi:hypothetical protein
MRAKYSIWAMQAKLSNIQETMKKNQYSKVVTAFSGLARLKYN